MAHHEMSERARSGEHNAGDGAEAEPAAERRVWVRRAALVVVLATVAVAVGAGGRQRRLRIDLGERRAFADKMGALHSVAAMHSGSLHDSMMLAAANVTDDNRTVGEAEEGFISGVDGSCLQPPHLHAYFVNQLFWTWVHTLEVSGVTVGEDGKEKTIPLGHVKSQPFSFVAEQTWRDDDGKVIAEAHQDAISTVTNTYVDDCAKKLIATVSEQLAPSSSAVSQYTIQNKDGDIVAVSTMSRNFGTEVDINDQTSGKRLVTVSKGWGQFTDAWSATFREVRHAAVWHVLFDSTRMSEMRAGSCRGVQASRSCCSTHLPLHSRSCCAIA